MTGIANRRHQLRKKKIKSRKIYGISKYANHLKSCSCHMCGNPRKFYNEKSIQEKRYA